MYTVYLFFFQICFSSAWRWRLRQFGSFLVSFFFIVLVWACQKVGLFFYQTLLIFQNLFFIQCKKKVISDFPPSLDLFAEPARFTLEDSSLTATEGSCAEIKCHVKRPVFERNFTWFWMKDAIWHAKNQSFTASIIYTSHISSHTVIGDYATRVKYIGSSFSTWNDLKVPHRCSILICNLKKADSGIYQFRFEGNTKWATEKMNLSVTGQWTLKSYKPSTHRVWFIVVL